MHPQGGNIRAYLYEAGETELCTAGHLLSAPCKGLDDLSISHWKYLKDICAFLREKRLQQKHNGRQMSLIGRHNASEQTPTRWTFLELMGFVNRFNRRKTSNNTLLTSKPRSSSSKSEKTSLLTRRRISCSRTLPVLVITRYDSNASIWSASLVHFVCCSLLCSPCESLQPLHVSLFPPVFFFSPEMNVEDNCISKAWLPSVTLDFHGKRITHGAEVDTRCEEDVVLPMSVALELGFTMEDIVEVSILLSVDQPAFNNADKMPPSFLSFTEYCQRGGQQQETSQVMGDR